MTIDNETMVLLSYSLWSYCELKMNLYFGIAFIICLSGYVFHTLAHFLGHKDKNPRISHRFASMVIFFGYIAWGFMMALDPVKIGLSDYIAVPLGLLIGLTGVLLFTWSTIAKKGFDEVGHLVTTGIYSKLRNPMYLGIILIHIGFPLVSQSLLTLVSAAIWSSQILIWKYWEEQDLQEKFGREYIEYKKETWF